MLMLGLMSKGDWYQNDVHVRIMLEVDTSLLTLSLINFTHDSLLPVMWRIELFYLFTQVQRMKIISGKIRRET